LCLFCNTVLLVREPNQEAVKVFGAPDAESSGGAE
jgi:hypothetical protein